MYELEIKFINYNIVINKVMLINAVKDVATALGDLIHATKAASGNNINDPSMNELKESAKVNY